MIDTLAAFQKLISVGFNERQAEAVVKLIGEAGGRESDNHAKADQGPWLQPQASSTFGKRFLDLQFAECHAAIRAGKTETIRWIVGSYVLLFAALVVLQNIRFH